MLYGNATNYEPDDLIGFDFSKLFSKVKKVAGKVKGIAKGIKGLRNKGKKAVASARGAVSPSTARAPSGVPVAATASAGAGGIVEFAKRNPLIAVGLVGALAFVLLKRKGRS
jgi:hypothetical protein